MSIIQNVKNALAIEDLVAERFTLRGRGRIRTTVEHDSLKVWTDSQTWYWFSRGVGGDIFDWWQCMHGCSFRQALVELSRRAGVEGTMLTPEEEKAEQVRRQRMRVWALAAGWFADRFGESPEARAYTAERGWSVETCRRERIGFNPRSNPGQTHEPLSQVLKRLDLLENPVARAVLSIPEGMLVYVHRRGGQAIYLSGRSLGGKRHYNPPEALAGPRQPYANDPAPGAEMEQGVVLVEGQADAISLGQLGISARAVCGAQGGDRADSTQKSVTHVAFDSDDAGSRAALDAALAVGPLCRVVTWPRVNGKPVSDANDLLLAGAEAGDVAEILGTALPAIEMLARQAGEAGPGEREARLRRLLDGYVALDELAAADLKPALARAVGSSIGHFNRLLNARARQRKGHQEAEARKQNNFVYSSGGSGGGLMWEQCLDRDADGQARTCYAVRLPNGSIETRSAVKVGGVVYRPYPPSLGLIAEKVVLFPERPHPYANQQQLLRRIQGFIHRYLDVDPFYERLSAYYILFTWLYDLFETLPYLRALGDYGTGKSRFLHTIGSLCYRPMFVSGASTTSPIFRIIDMFRGTLIIDEADFASSEADAEIIKILNVGYHAGGVVLRSEKDPAGRHDEYWPIARKVYGPKILATRRMFADRATESRCLTRRMAPRRPRPDIPYTLTAVFWDEARALRNQLLCYRLQNHRPTAIDPHLADDSIEPRLNQVTLALKATVDDPAMLGEIDGFVRAYNQTLIQDRQMTLPAVVVQVLAQIFYRPEEELFGARRDFSIKAITEVARELLLDIDPDIKLSPKKVGQILSEELGLTRRGSHPHTRRATVLFEEHELVALMRRYGVAEERDEAPA